MQDASAIITQLRNGVTALKNQQAKERNSNKALGPGSTAVGAAVGVGSGPDCR